MLRTAKGKKSSKNGPNVLLEAQHFGNQAELANRKWQ
jgi:hypothetical protein